jgi:hypothetical protein
MMYSSSNTLTMWEDNFGDQNVSFSVMVMNDDDFVNL